MLAVFASVVGCLQSAAAATLNAENLRCEYLKDPLGIDVTQPRLSWELRTPAQSPAISRGVKQRSYQVLVASSAELLKADRGDLWDSGEVQSDQSVHVEYAGKSLGSRQGCWWKVRVWGQEAKPSSWSEAARWSMGLLARENWTGKWIGLDGGEETVGSLKGATWIWYPEGEPASSAPAEARVFRRVVRIPAGRRVAKATVLMTADDGFTLYINGERVSQSEGHPNAVETDVTAQLHPGSNTLAVAAYNKPGPPQNPAGLIGEAAR